MNSTNPSFGGSYRLPPSLAGVSPACRTGLKLPPPKSTARETTWHMLGMAGCRLPPGAPATCGHGADEHRIELEDGAEGLLGVGGAQCRLAVTLQHQLLVLLLQKHQEVFEQQHMQICTGRAEREGPAQKVSPGRGTADAPRFSGRSQGFPWKEAALHPAAGEGVRLRPPPPCRYQAGTSDLPSAPNSVDVKRAVVLTPFCLFYPPQSTRLLSGGNTGSASHARDLPRPWRCNPCLPHARQTGSSLLQPRAPRASLRSLELGRLWSSGA